MKMKVMAGQGKAVSGGNTSAKLSQFLIFLRKIPTYLGSPGTVLKKNVEKLGPSVGVVVHQLATPSKPAAHTLTLYIQNSALPS
jgi:hypothetical protein